MRIAYSTHSGLEYLGVNGVATSHKYCTQRLSALRPSIAAACNANKRSWTSAAWRCFEIQFVQGVHALSEGLSFEKLFEAWGTRLQVFVRPSDMGVDALCVCPTRHNMAFSFGFAELQHGHKNRTSTGLRHCHYGNV